MSRLGDDRPLVSVVIPMFQAASWIRETLASVSDQTYPQIEIIVVDDGSTDGGAEIVTEFAAGSESPVRLIRTTNRGVASARNTGIEESTGTFVALLDADDVSVKRAFFFPPSQGWMYRSLIFSRNDTTKRGTYFFEPDAKKREELELQLAEEFGPKAKIVEPDQTNVWEY